ncbi:hypothetical protein BpHYR1_038545 [Brachionus plicatilis]|uniref:Uncharacterized protein n=1 Tax=Brachionus plicatilis TaxID=10195 RepID=A0A3M7SNF6_BRAPC|nr:hypothetical protein BpHYR1_038545 [Brachionus plicatilis]
MTDLIRDLISSLKNCTKSLHLFGSYLIIAQNVIHYLLNFANIEFLSFAWCHSKSVFQLLLIMVVMLIVIDS